MAEIAALRRLIEVHATKGSAGIAGLSLSLATSPTEPTSAIARPIFALPVQGRKRIVFAGQIYDYGAGDFLVVSVDLPITGQFLEASRDEPALGVGLDLRPEVIAALILEALPDEGRPFPRSVPPLAVNQASGVLLDAVHRMLLLLDHPEDIPALAPLIEREIGWRLLTGPSGEVVRQIGLMDSSFSQVGRIIRAIREHPAEPFRIEQLAEQANMSLSTFHRHFRAITSLSPVQFQKRIRLQEARLLLMSSELDVAEAAFAVGYDSPSQFIREYRREYGASPGRDAARMRAEPVFGSITGLP
jgi:AraC-like DNA-binding protein